MPDIAEIVRSGSVNPWVYLPAALLLGALHALEPGHSKSMMAAFIVAVRGTPWQATVLGLSAAIGHTVVIWLLAIVGLSLGDHLVLEKAEPWLILATGVLIIVIAIRILARLATPQSGGTQRQGSEDDNHVLGCRHDHKHHHPHAGLGQEDHCHDSHAAGHAADLKRQFSGRQVTTSDIAWFGFTAGLLPCPAAFAVLLVCLQLKAVALGVAMVAAFSSGLAITLVAIGIAAALGVSSAGKWFPTLERWTPWLPYASATIIFAVGVAISLQGLGRLGFA